MAVGQILSLRDKRFINAYFGVSPNGTKCRMFNASAAARAIGVKKKSSGSAAYQLMQKPAVKKEIAKRLEEIDADRALSIMKGKEILDRTSAHARTDLTTIIGDNGKIDSDLLYNIGGSLKKYRTEKRIASDGAVIFSTHVEIIDPLKALIALGKHYSLWSQQKDETIGIEKIARAFQESIDLNSSEIEDVLTELEVKGSDLIDLFNGT